MVMQDGRLLAASQSRRPEEWRHPCKASFHPRLLMLIGRGRETSSRRQSFTATYPRHREIVLVGAVDGATAVGRSRSGRSLRRPHFFDLRLELMHDSFRGRQLNPPLDHVRPHGSDDVAGLPAVVPRTRGLPRGCSVRTT